MERINGELPGSAGASSCCIPEDEGLLALGFTLLRTASSSESSLGFSSLTVAASTVWTQMLSNQGTICMQKLKELIELQLLRPFRLLHALSRHLAGMEERW